MNIPVIDCEQPSRTAAVIAHELDEALSTAGFMAVRNIGLPAAAIRAAFELSQRFFAASAKDKQRCAYGSAEENFGYQGLLGEKLDPARPADLKESFTMRNILASQIAPDRWPSADFQHTMTSFYTQVMAAAQRLQGLLALSLGLDEAFFRRCHHGENVTLRLLHYPQVSPGAVAKQQMGAGEHTDYGMLTLLLQDNVGGLEVQSSDGSWIAVAPLEDTILVNSGDLLERWTNGRYRSTRHRVRPNSANRDRYSIALFVDPDSDTLIEALASCVSPDNPSRYRPTTAGKHLQEKIEATHLG